MKILRSTQPNTSPAPLILIRSLDALIQDFHIDDWKPILVLSVGSDR
jgi:hypothetical protein